jgi:hypothetical protein
MIGYELYDWQPRFNREGLTFGLRVELLELLRPHVKLQERVRLPDQLGRTTSPQAPTRIKDLVDWEIVLGTSDVHDILTAIGKNSLWQKSLPELLPHLTSLLLEALDLMRQLEGADDRSDGSYWHQPSIAEHPQNQKFRDWTALIDLTRDAWIAAATQNPNAARAEVQRWLGYPYPLFRRLAFFAATTTDLFSSATSIQWLLADQNWWLWSVETEREAIRLMTKLAKTLPISDSRPLQMAILQGPPRQMFGDEVDTDRYRHIADREIWLRLAKYEDAADTPLNGEAAEALARISKNFPDWRLDPNESDEFPVWMGEAGDWFKKQNTPKELSALEEYLRNPISIDQPTNDDWFERAKDDFPIAIAALINLGKADVWPTQRWRTALQVWSDPSLLLRSWDQLKDLLSAAPDSVVAILAQPLSWWLQALGKVITDGTDEFFGLLRRILATQMSEAFDGGNDPVFKAINHPVGQSTDAVFRWWYRQTLKDDQGLHGAPRNIFSDLCEVEIASFRFGRIILAANLVALYRVDREWTKRFLLQNLDWRRNAEEARAAWSGFLWAPRLYAPLLASIKAQFLETVKHYGGLGQFGRQYANLLTYVSLEAPESFAKKDLALATSLLSADGLAHCAFSLVQALDSSGQKRVEYWRNRVRPYIKDIWPKSADVVTPSIANSFARLCMKADEAFPEAVSELKPWLSSATAADVTLHAFRETNLAKRFPEATLTFLDAVLTQRPSVLPDDLRASLNDIGEEKPNLKNDPRFERLSRHVRQLGG